MLDKKLYDEITEKVFNIPIFDTHEHILDEEDRKKHKLDFSSFFSIYSATDLQISGMSQEDFLLFQNEDTEVNKKWELFSPHWENVKNTNYAKVLFEVLKGLYGFTDITVSNYIELSKKIEDTKKEKWYDYVINKKSNVCKVLNHLDNVKEASIRFADRKDFRHVLNLDDMVMTCCPDDIAEVEKRFDTVIYSLKDFLSVIDIIFENSVKNSYIGLKIALAYIRDIQFDETSFAEAEKAFIKLFKLKNYGYIKDRKDFLSKSELKPFQDYIVHYLVRKAFERDVPVQIHTGILEGLYNDVSNSRPAYLINLLIKYKKCRFDIFHAGYPYSDELMAICKQFPNAYFNLCWVSAISSQLYRNILERLIEIIPSNKILGFGGDYVFVEGMYGAQQLARKTISETLHNKVQEGYFTLEQAIGFAEKILYSNPSYLYKW
jgi:hypothetical protein